MRFDIDYKNRQFWSAALLTEAVVSAPFVFLALHSPVAALVGWSVVTLLYVGAILVFGDGSLIEAGVAAFILGSLIASCIYIVDRVRAP